MALNKPATANRTVIFRNTSVIVRYSRIFGRDLSLLLMKNTDQLDAIANPRLAERLNGWAAMMGFWALIGAYVSTGQIIPGIV